MRNMDTRCQYQNMCILNHIEADRIYSSRSLMFCFPCLFFVFFRTTRMPSMYAEDDGISSDFGRCSDVRCTRPLAGQSSTSHFISEGFVQYSQPSFNGMVELYQSSASINMCSQRTPNNLSYDNQTTFSTINIVE